MSNLPSTRTGCSSDERGFQQIRLRQDTEANWFKNNPIPASGEMCYTIGGDSGANLKVGDGTRQWSDLPYLAARGMSGPPGAPGEDGHSMTVYGPSTSPPSPSVTQLYAGDVWLSDGLYAQNPNFDADKIQPGAPGPPGEAATIDNVSAVGLPYTDPPTATNVGDIYHADIVFGIPAGEPGPPGIQGPVGSAGPQGPAGETFKIEGAVATEADLPPNPPLLACYVTQDTSHLYIYDPSSGAALPSGYVDLGAIMGPTGASTFYSNPVATAADLPAVGADGQCIIALDTGHMHSWSPANQSWTDAGKVVGPAGDGIVDGSIAGQVPVWSPIFNNWSPALLGIESMDDVDFAATPTDGQILRYSTDHWDADDQRLSDQVDVDLTNPPVDGQVLTWSTDHWEAADVSTVASLDDLTDVNAPAPTDGQLLQFDGASGEWKPVDAGGIGSGSDAYTDERVTELSDYLGRSVTVQGKYNAPPLETPGQQYGGVYYIVDQYPTGAWSGKANKIAYYARGRDGNYAWQFAQAYNGQTLFSQADGKWYRLNATAVPAWQEWKPPIASPDVSHDFSGQSIIRSNNVSGALINLDAEVARLSQSQVFAGTFDGVTDRVDIATAAGVSAGFSAGQALPTAAAAIQSYFLHVVTTGTANGAACQEGDRLWCDGSQWIVIAGPSSGSSPVTSVFGRIGDIIAAANDYNASQIAYSGLAAGTTVLAGIDDNHNRIDGLDTTTASLQSQITALTNRVTALEGRTYLLGTYSRHGKDDSWAWQSSGGATGNVGELNKHSANLETIAWGSHGVVLSGNNLQINQAGLYQIMVECQIGGTVNNKFICLSVEGNYTNGFCRNSYNQDSAFVWHMWYRKTTTTATNIELNLFGGGMSFDFGVPSISIARFST